MRQQNGPCSCVLQDVARSPAQIDRFVLHENGWSGRLIHEIRREDVNQLVREIAKETPVLAKRVYAAVSVLFSWLREQKIIDTSPCNREPSKRYDAV
jgi:hypothetical protein